MIYIFCFGMPYLLGRGALRALYRKNRTQDISFADSMLTGGMVMIGLAEAAHLVAIVLGRSFSDSKKMFLIGLVFLLIMAGMLIIVEQWRKKKDKKATKEAERLRIKRVMSENPHQIRVQILYFLFGAMVLIQLLSIVIGQRIYLAGDMTVETVNSILATDTIYQVNPLTGQAYTLGIPMRLKMLCLPTFYAVLCDLFGMSAISVVWSVVPAFVLLGSYLAFYSVAKALFQEDVFKRGIFMVVVALLLWFGDYMYGVDGFGVQYAGFRGVSIRMTMLLPYTFGLLLRKKWRLVLLCVLTEACVVWTLYGMGSCLLVAVGMIMTEFVGNKLLHHKVLKHKGEIQRGKEEDSL